MSLTFVVGTGRCGSTALSRLLHAHPDVLSVSELFAMAKGPLHPEAGEAGAALPGAQVWQQLTAPVPVMDAFAQAGLATPEMVYPYRTGRFSPLAGVPQICHMTLPMLSRDPDDLFDQLAAEVCGWPARPAADQYRALFGFLAGLLGRRVVVERSGSSLPMVARLHEMFPEARFVHMYRDGPDCALSMSRHPLFRLRGVAADLKRSMAGRPPGPPPPDLMERLTGILVPPHDPERILAYPVPLAFFGEMWSQMVTTGVSALAGLPPGSWTSLRYEDVLARPAAALAGLADFLGVPAPPPWLEQAAALFGGRQAGAATALPTRELAGLRAACEPGTQAITAAPRPPLAAARP